MQNQTELIIKHLELIQNIVNRMAGNSFMLKGWSVTIVSALLVFDAANKNTYCVWIAFLPAITFWVLDAYFLSQERYFRRLYDRVREPLVSSETAQKTEPFEIFSMKAPLLAKSSDHWFPVMRSKTLLIFHGMVVLFIAIVIVVSK